MNSHHILVTGAAGLVGAEVTARLAAAGHTVYALVHANGEIVRNNGKRLRTVALQDAEPGRVVRLRGDVTAPDLGLSPSERAALTPVLDRVVHSAAVTEFGYDWPVYESVNLGGTRTVLGFCERNAIPLVHVSTAYVCGERTGLVLETDLDAGQAFGTHYERSKFVAEQEVRAAGLPVAVVRPSLVVGTERTGVVRDFKNMYVVLKLFTQGRVRSVPGFYDALLDLVPVDHAATVICRAAEEFERAEGRTFHAVGAGPHSLLDFSNVLAEYPSFQVPRFVTPSSFSADRLPFGERVYYERIVSRYESFFRRRARFDDAAAVELVGARPSSRGPAYLRKLLDHCLRVGYLGTADEGIDEVLAGLSS